MNYKIEEAAAIVGVSHNTIRKYIREDWIEYEQINDRGDYCIPAETVKLLTWMKAKFDSTRTVTTGLRLMAEEDDTNQHVRALMSE